MADPEHPQGQDPEQSVRPGKVDKAGMGRLYSSGFEFAAAVAGFTLIGYWIDHHYGSSPKGLLIGLGLGLVGATWNLIRGAWTTTGRKADRPGSPAGPKDADGDDARGRDR
jgi:F0F1-type ATP synthase assembly protein I